MADGALPVRSSHLRAGGQVPFAQRAVSGRLIPSAPRDTVAALGALGRKLYLVPRLELVVTRLGAMPQAPPPAEDSHFDEELWQRLVAART